MTAARVTGRRLGRQSSVFTPGEPSSPLYIERVFLLRRLINQSIHNLHFSRSLYSNSHPQPTR